MTVFDLLFLAVALASVVCWVAAAAVLPGAHRRAFRILRAWSLGFAVYMMVVIGVSVAEPRRVMQVGEPLCFDDW